MSILENLIDGLLGSDHAESEPKPCSNCAGNCSIYPDACEECKEYKTKLLDQLYYVEHSDEYYEKYVIAGTSDQVIEINDCPSCGAGGQTGCVCEYCGTTLKADDGKIHVDGASEIPDPIQTAQEIIFSRHEIVKKYAPSENTGLLNSLINAVTGNDSFGKRMSTDEIKSTAAAYGVTAGSYLAGLDNGVYLTASAKKKQEEEERQKAALAAQVEKAKQEQARTEAARREEQMRRLHQEQGHVRQDSHDHYDRPDFQSHNVRPDFQNHTGRPGFQDHNGHPGFQDHTGRPDLQDHNGRRPDGPDMSRRNGHTDPHNRGKRF